MTQVYQQEGYKPYRDATFDEWKAAGGHCSSQKPGTKVTYRPKYFMLPGDGRAFVSPVVHVEEEA